MREKAQRAGETDPPGPAGPQGLRQLPPFCRRERRRSTSASTAALPGNQRGLRGAAVLPPQPSLGAGARSEGPTPRLHRVLCHDLLCGLGQAAAPLCTPRPRGYTRPEALNSRCSGEHEERSTNPLMFGVRVSIRLFRVKVLKGVLAAAPGQRLSRAFASCKNLYIYASEPKNKAEPSPAEHRNPETYHSSHMKPHPSQCTPNGDSLTHVRHFQRQCLLTLSRSVHAHTHLAQSQNLRAGRSFGVT